MFAVRSSSRRADRLAGSLGAAEATVDDAVGADRVALGSPAGREPSADIQARVEGMFVDAESAS